MQVFKTFFRIAKKHLVQVGVYTGVFLILIFMMSFTAQKTEKDKFSADSVNVTIIDEDQSTLSKGIYDFIDSRHEIVELRSTDAETLTDNLFYQTVSYVLTIPKGFEDSFLAEGTLTLTHNMREDSASGFFVNQQVDSFLNSVDLYMTGGFTIEESIASTMENFENSPEVTLITFEEKSNATNPTMFYYFQYMCYIFLMIFSVSLVPILVTFHQEDLNARISCSSTSAQSRNIQIGLGCLVYSVLTWAVFILLAVIFFKPASVFSEQGVLCLLNSFIFTLICTSITLVLSTFNLKDNALNLISNIIGLAMSFLCGVFVPQWLLSEKVLAFSKFLPAYWYTKIINMLSGWSGEPYSLSNYWKYIGIEVIFLIAIFSIYLVANKQRKKGSIA